jgi:GalNAc-alpha-(1->4)-GalNAc-alpha-(1->3)-diNAcBac-PP-undecaprenol alpha-1,4-N-acetyl-D-galactosaminyltransferase
MKLLVVIPSMQRGGAERVVSLLCSEWTRNHEVILAIFDASAPAYEISARVVDLRAASALGIMRKLINPILRTKRLARLISREQPDRIFSFMESANFPAVLAACLCGREQDLTVSVHNDPRSFPWFHRWLLPYFYRLAKRVVAVSRGVAERLHFMGIEQRRLSVIPNPVDRSILQRRAEEPMPAGLIGKQAFILGVGRLVRQKGFDRLIDAFAQLPNVELKLVILGEGPERPRLERQVMALGLASRITLPGAVENPFPFYRRAHCFVLSSRHEGFGNVLVEAMALECPVIAFDCDFGPSEIIMDGNNGLLVQEGDIEGLAGAISRLNEDVGLRNRVVESAMVTINTLFSTKVANYWLDA